MSMYPSSTDKILSRLLKHFNYDILSIGKFFDIDGDKELTKAEFKVMCKNLIKEIENDDIEGAFLNIAEDVKAHSIPIKVFEDAL